MGGLSVSWEGRRAERCSPSARAGRGQTLPLPVGLSPLVPQAALQSLGSPAPCCVNCSLMSQRRVRNQY